MWLYKFTFYIVCFILGMVIIVLGLRYAGDGIDDTRSAQMITTHDYQNPQATVYAERGEAYYIGTMDARCESGCMGPGKMDILMPGYSRMSLLGHEGGTWYIHCLSYSESSKPWSDSGLQWWGAGMLPLETGADVMGLDDETLADVVLQQIDEVSWSMGCQIREGAWEGERDEIRRLIVRALR